MDQPPPAGVQPTLSERKIKKLANFGETTMTGKLAGNWKTSGQKIGRDRNC